MIDFAKGGRRDTIRALLVDLADNDYVIGELSGFVDGSLSFSYYTTDKTSGEITVTDPAAVGGALVRIVCDMEQGGEKQRMTLGTYFASYDSRTELDGAVSASLTLQSTLKRLSDDKMEKEAVYQAGSWGRSAVEQILDGCMEPYRYESEISESLRPSTSHAYDIGETKSTVCNELLASLGAASLSVDSDGNAVIRPYVAPSDREVSWVFDDSTAMVVPGIEVSKDSVPNKVIATSTADGETLSTCLVLGDESEFCAKAVGRYIAEAYDCDAATQEELDGIAARYLAEIVSAAETVTITHLYAPIREGDVVRLCHESARGDYMVKSMEIELAPGLPTKTELSRIRYLEVQDA